MAAASILAAAAPLASLVSCGGLVLEIPSEAGAMDAGVDAAPDGSFFEPPPPVPTGPCGVLGQGKCTREGLVCEIGEDPSSPCNTLTICRSGELQPLAVTDSQCPTINAGIGAACPGYEVNPPVGDGGGNICTAGTTCDYPQGRCQCSVVAPERAPAWHCVDPGAACSSTRPRLGQPCTQGDQRCVYQACGVTPSFGAQSCDAGLWVAAEPNTCPG